MVSGPGLRQPPGRAARRCRRRATTSRSTSPTRRWSSSATPRRSPRTSRSSSTSARAPATRRTTPRRSGPTSTRASSTWATRRTGSWCSSGRSRWGSSPRRPSSRRSTRTSTRRAPTARAGPSSTRVRPWESLTDDEKRLFARMAEVYAGFLSHADHEIGRLLDYLEQSGQLDNTMIVLVSDNGASGEGGPNGSVNENKIFNGIPDTHRGEPAVPRRAGQPADLQPLPDRLGVGVQHPVQAVEAVLQLRGRHRRPDDRLLAGADHRQPGVRRQYTHAVDIVPTIYEASGSSRPRSSRATRRSRSRASASTPPSTTRRPRPTSRRSSTRWAAPGRSGTRAGRPPRSRRPRRTCGRLRDPALGAVRHRRGPERVPRPGRRSSRRSCRS